jgi:DNA (cytosine-5)-methyltransferase 1
VLVEEYLGENFSDGEQSAPLSGNPTQQAYCAPDKMMDFSRLSRFGMTYKPLMEIRGEELLTLYRAAFHVQTLAQREKAQESMEKTQDSGEKWRGSFVKYSPDSHSWKTHQCSLLGDLDEFLETWPQWGLMRDGECWEQQTLAQTIRGTESGLSPNGVDSFHTPNTTGLDGGSNSRKALKHRQEKLPTPTASDYKSQPTSKSWKAKGAINYKLSNPEIQEKWPTPLASDWKPRGPNSKQQGLAEKVKNWPTPTAHMAKETNAPSEHNRNTPILTAQVNWPTPRTKGMCGGSGSWDLLNKNTTKEEARQMGAGNGGKLNPMWVEWLMGWPLGWTDLKPLAMDKSHCVQQPLGES